MWLFGSVVPAPDSEESHNVLCDNNSTTAMLLCLSSLPLGGRGPCAPLLVDMLSSRVCAMRVYHDWSTKVFFLKLTSIFILTFELYFYRSTTLVLLIDDFYIRTAFKSVHTPSRPHHPLVP
jgi:hypothetical protein